MSRAFRLILLCSASLFVCMTVAAVAPVNAPYAGQQMRDIKSLSTDEIDAYLSGKGAGMAKAAELNGYPGPAHVLELAKELRLTPVQREATEALFAKMQSDATEPGRELVEGERKLDQLFATKTITPEALGSALSEISALQARVRRAHLSAHLAQAAILTPEQNALYGSLRGYGGSDAGMTEHQHHHMQ